MEECRERGPNRISRRNGGYIGNRTARVQTYYYYVDHGHESGLTDLVVLRHYGNDLPLEPLIAGRHSVCQTLVILPADMHGLVLRRRASR